MILLNVFKCHAGKLSQHHCTQPTKIFVLECILSTKTTCACTLFALIITAFRTSSDILIEGLYDRFVLYPRNQIDFQLSILKGDTTSSRTEKRLLFSRRTCHWNTEPLSSKIHSCSKDFMLNACTGQRQSLLPTSTVSLCISGVTIYCCSVPFVWVRQNSSYFTNKL